MDAKQFLTTYSTSLNQWDATLVAHMAQAQGYQFTADELETAADELWGNLSEDQLRDIAGAGSSGRTTTGPISPDLSTAGSVTTSEVYSPPPGDVSGNSCFFTRR
jgi:hypothetical protein